VPPQIYDCADIGTRLLTGGYLVDLRTDAYKGGQALYVTGGPVDWSEWRRWVWPFRVDPGSGLHVKDGKPIHIRPRQPVQKGSRNWSNVVEDVVEVRDSEWGLLVRLTHIAPSPNARTLNDEFTKWACGYGARASGGLPF